MIFSELYGAYYSAVAEILKEGLTAPPTEKRIGEIAREKAFGESFITIENSLKKGKWKLLTEEKTPIVKSVPELPLTLLQKRWLKAISLDPRIRLFGEILPDFPDVEPLFRQEDICVYDRYADGDDYSDENYIRRFRMILDAIGKGSPLKFEIKTGQGRIDRMTAWPECLEYSEKDDKFRVITSGCRFGKTINLARILSCEAAEKAPAFRPDGKKRENKKVTLLVTDERNAPDRVFLHFAHFEKEAEKTNDGRYLVTIGYDACDETEILIRVLSFGPMVKVVSPESFINLIKKRLNMQKSCGL